MTITVHRSEERGAMKLDWLDSKFSFSFADYHNPRRMGFGALRVLNDDIIAPHSGFGMHHHADMEIITIILKGTIDHEDSMGNKYSLSEGEVQVMSTGTGIMHSEKNSQDEDTHLLQIWVYPDKRGHTPRYNQRKFEIPTDELTTLVDKNKDNALTIHQEVVIRRGKLSEGQNLDFNLKEGRGLFIFVIQGEVRINDQILRTRDSAEITESVRLEIKEESDVLFIEIPHQKD